MTTKHPVIAIIGLGYVGLPLAVEFGKQYRTIGFDIDGERIQQLMDGVDRTREVEPELLQQAQHLTFSDQISAMQDATVFIVTVPTPIDVFKTPDLGPLRGASRTVAKALKVGDTVIYESTVYPGATEEVCVPLLEAGSGLVFNRDFTAGYSPERVNPGDKEHRIASIRKVTSGSTPQAADFIDGLYRSVITAGTHKATSIKVAEAAKVIENTQRDVNIALVNELTLIFEKLDIDTQEILEAAATKWNFLPFRPGLVGGHCIGVDPYYLTYKAQAVGHHPEMILSGRRINDSMGPYIAERVIKLMTKNRIPVVDSRVLIMGLTFKENCPDIRNTRVTDLIKEFQNYHAKVDVWDPWADARQVMDEYALVMTKTPDRNTYDAIILAVGHREFLDLSPGQIRALGKERHILFDVKHVLPKACVDARL
ncbi:MAG: nucleotide sugar dehydrogenase [Halomonadaceae bacterium]|nr:MAG: nucleotide sugar dehydrogenase [Halomonadaceae bacterium]